MSLCAFVTGQRWR